MGLAPLVFLVLLVLPEAKCRMKSTLRTLFLVCIVAPLTTGQDQQVRLEIMDFFGSSGIDLAQLRGAMPIHTGSVFMRSSETALKEQIRQTVVEMTGHDPTDITLVCCTDKGGTMCYIGLRGRSYRPFIYNKTPTGMDKLPQQGLHAYEQAQDALQHAVESGQASEDDSKGYALVSDPAGHAAELSARRYALHHETVIRHVLATSSDVASRQAASELLGYARQSQAQIDSLTVAARDPDDEVRNNAIRALGVLASSNTTIAAEIPPQDFIAMLNSGIWTDRNKGGFLLVELTASRDPQVLRGIDLQARDSLIEMSRWHNTGHAYVYRVLLGRIAGIEEKRLQMLAAGIDEKGMTLANGGAQVEVIISALPPK